MSSYGQPDRCGIHTPRGTSIVYRYQGCGLLVANHGRAVWGVPGMPETESMTYHAECVPTDVVPRNNHG
jgi:hypothetical protein